MQWEYILLRYGEIFLKGKNRAFFENKLESNLKKIAKIKRIKKIRGRLITDYFPEHQTLKRVFGLVSYSPAVKVAKEWEAIKAGALDVLRNKEGTFKIEPKRSDKSFPLTSPEINITLGKFIEENTSLKFEGKNPQHFLGVEINVEGVYLFNSTIPCLGGLPVGVEGRVAVLIDNQADNQAGLLAGLLLMKRGCDIFPVGFKEKDISLLQKFSPTPLRLYVVRDFTELEELMPRNKLSALALGQSFESYKRYHETIPVLRPLIAYPRAKIKEELKEYSSA
ncbi:hypothetical protein HZC32_01960 [Candidatus Woesearchaeota archaeon]|nr:hypothetical protein [Candidatus Woesearchaeota archaeon]